jgi:outer membrane protein, heavy metal efflux system
LLTIGGTATHPFRIAVRHSRCIVRKRSMPVSHLLLPNSTSTRFVPIALGVLVLLGGCATPQVDPPSLTAESGATAFAARSLRDPKLQGFLRANVGRVPDTWDFESLCWVGFYYHPSLELARAQWETARATQRTAGQRPNPTLTLSPGYNFTREAGISPWMPSVGADFLFQSTTKADRMRQIAANDAESARLGVVTTAWQMRSELRKALIAATAAERKAASLRTQVGLQRQLLGRLEQQFAAGSIAAADLSTSRSALLRSEAAAAEAQTQLATGRTRVAAALGLPVTALEGITLPLPPTPSALGSTAFVEVRRQSLQTRADLLAALAKYHSAQAALELEVAKQFPDIHLGPGYQWDQGANKWSLGISFELPIFHRNEGPIGEALARRSEAAAQFNVVQAQAVAAIDGAAAAYEAASAQADRTRRLRSEVEREVALAQQRQELGASDQVEAQTARLDLATTEMALVDAETAIASAAGDLEDALQVPFPNLAALTPLAR